MAVRSEKDAVFYEGVKYNNNMDMIRRVRVYASISKSPQANGLKKSQRLINISSTYKNYFFKFRII